MTNPYYTPSGAPPQRGPGTSAQIRAEMALVQVGFDKLPTLAANARKPVQVNAAGTGLEAFSGGGTTTPTVTATLNCNTPTVTKCIFTRNYDTVTVAGKAGASALAAGPVTFEISLPVASNLALTDDLTGVLNAVGGASGVTAEFVSTSVANDRAVISFTAAGAGVYNFRYLLMYSVL